MNGPPQPKRKTACDKPHFLSPIYVYFNVKKTLLADHCEQDYKALYSSIYIVFVITFKALWKFNFLVVKRHKGFFCVCVCMFCFAFLSPEHVHAPNPRLPR